MAGNVEISKLIEEADYNVKLAAFLADEGHYKVATSRAYYAMFYTVEALHLKDGRAYKSHKATISGFAQHFAKTGIFPKESHSNLVRAFEMRKDADYDVLKDTDESKSNLAISWAEDLILRAKSYLNEIDGLL